MNLGERSQEKKMLLWGLELKDYVKDVTEEQQLEILKKKKNYYTKENVITVYQHTLWTILLIDLF